MCLYPLPNKMFTKIINSITFRLAPLMLKTNLALARRKYWDFRVRDIHDAWGEDNGDYETVSKILQIVKPRRILDFGCGSGRLFPLYQQKDVPKITAFDISKKAVNLCKQRFSDMNVQYRWGRIDNLQFPNNYFDLVISSRALSAVTQKDIQKYIKRLCVVTRYIYLNEYSNSDYNGHCDYWFRHDYPDLLTDCGFCQADSGLIGKQTWMLFTCNTNFALNNNECGRKV